jgi:branched-chain amino acid transport system substrate-binding protein
MKATLSPLAAAALALATAAGAQAQVSNDVVKVGLLVDMSGLYSDLSGPGSVIAARMAIDDFGGEVLGKPVELVSSDSLNKADVASSKAREWFDTGHVDAILDLVPTNAALAVMEIAAQKNKIAVVVGSASTPITNEKCTPISVHWMYDTSPARSASAARSPSRATIAGSSLPPITRSARRSRRTCMLVPLINYLLQKPV